MCIQYTSTLFIHPHTCFTGSKLQLPDNFWIYSKLHPVLCAKLSSLFSFRWNKLQQLLALVSKRTTSASGSLRQICCLCCIHTQVRGHPIFQLQRKLMWWSWSLGFEVWKNWEELAGSAGLSLTLMIQLERNACQMVVSLRCYISKTVNPRLIHRHCHTSHYK